MEKTVDHLELKDINTDASLAQLTAYHPNVFIIAGYSTIFKAPLLAIPSLGTLNLHAGPLPEYRGGSPLNWQIINGESKAGISVIRVDEGIDTGPVLAETIIEIGPRDTIRDLHDRANDLFPGLVVEAITRLKSKDPLGRVQTDANAQYWHQRSDVDGHLDFRHMRAVEADRMIRAISSNRILVLMPIGKGIRCVCLLQTLPHMCVRGMPLAVSALFKVKVLMWYMR